MPEYEKPQQSSASRQPQADMTKALKEEIMKPIYIN
jgi:hypothetical protein